jgi:hypothetical protein
LHSTYAAQVAGVLSAPAQVPDIEIVPIPLTAGRWVVSLQDAPAAEPVEQVRVVVVPGALPGLPTTIVHVMVWPKAPIACTWKFCSVEQLAGIIVNGQGVVLVLQDAAVVFELLPLNPVNSVPPVNAAQFLIVCKLDTP